MKPSWLNNSLSQIPACVCLECMIPCMKNARKGLQESQSNSWDVSFTQSDLRPAGKQAQDGLITRGVRFICVVDGSRF